MANSYLQQIQLQRDKISSFEKYPFDIPAIHNLHTLTLHPKVTFFIGENGMGKSTLMEAIAIALGLNPEGGSKNFRFSTRASHSSLHKFIQLEKGFKKPKDCYFLRAESYFNVATEIENLDRESDFGPPVSSYYGGESLHEQSHGESFFTLFLERFYGNGLYLLDEPEAALSPTRQMSFLSRIHQLIEKNSQFIVATHSPIIMAYPNSTIYLFSKEGKIQKTEYRDTDHYQVSREFLNSPEKMLQILMEEAP